MRIAIIGTRGIPNHYGGFEQCAEYLAAGLVKKGYEVVVYNSHNHPYKASSWNGVEICHAYDPEFKVGTMGQFIYDLNCIMDVRRKKFDIVLQLGYTSSSVWYWLMPRKSIITTNMDGLEWKRTKYSKPVQNFLRFAERLAAVHSDYLIADSTAIQYYLKEKYRRQATYIPYGAVVFEDANQEALSEYNLEPHNYDMLVARMEPENNVETILDGVAKASTGRDFLVIGCANNKYSIYLKEKFAGHSTIRFYDGIYDMKKLNNLRHFSNLYFHGHTVGGTNPSLLEAMASNSLICAHKNMFNQAVLGADALYFTDSNDIAEHLTSARKESGAYADAITNNLKKIKDVYSCDTIVDAYAAHFEAITKPAATTTYVPRAVPELQPEVSFQLKNL